MRGMKKTLGIFGAGKIGDALCALICEAKKYNVVVFDSEQAPLDHLKANWEQEFSKVGLKFEARKIDLKIADSAKLLMKELDAALSALPFFCNVELAHYCAELGVHYFDLTEDVETTKAIKKIASQCKTEAMFMPQCGLAPGFISIAAHSLVLEFDSVETVRMRVGALPLFPSNRLKYNLTWSTEGLINEYGNPCELLENGKMRTADALEGEERFSLDGVEYEAFNTSGGLGTLCETLSGKVNNLNYKSIRYPGHLEYIRFLMKDLQFNENRTELKKIFERAIPNTKQDKCIVYVEVVGKKKGALLQKTFVKTVYSGNVAGTLLGAIQITTASGILAPVDIFLSQKNLSKGFQKIEQIPLQEFLANEFGHYYS
jgi:saccharopine dehydrogenase-like NADP-dependent oxidoreductase